MNNNSEDGATLPYDVMVVGGGAAGVGAAVGAVQAGARTLLIEEGPCLGGAATQKNVLGYCGLYTMGDPPMQAVFGVAEQMLACLRALGGVQAPAQVQGAAVALVDPEAVKLALDRVVTSAFVSSKDDGMEAATCECKAYPSDLTDAQWQILEPLIPTAQMCPRRGQAAGPPATRAARSSTPSSTSRAMAAPGGRCPTTYPRGAWCTTTFGTGRRTAPGRAPTTPCVPRSGCGRAGTRRGRSSPARASGRRKGGPHGFDGGKRVNGRKRHLLVDTGGLILGFIILGCVVTPANVGDHEGARRLAAPGAHLGGRGYGGPLVEEVRSLYGYGLEIVAKLSGRRGFTVLPRRWVVERSFAWSARFRRLAKDYERLPETLAGLHFVAFAILMLVKAVTRLKSA